MMLSAYDLYLSRVSDTPKESDKTDKTPPVENQPTSKIVALRTKICLIHERICLLRTVKQPGMGTRPRLMEWIQAQIDTVAANCDVNDADGYLSGYADTDDPFADVALRLLEEEFGELTRSGNPYPIPASDPRARLGNGKLV